MKRATGSFASRLSGVAARCSWKPRRGAGRRALLPCALALAAAACASAPPVHHPDTDLELPARWTAAGDGPPEGRPGLPDAWWTDFGDPGLTSVVEQALQANTDLLAASARLEQAAAQARVAGADLVPQLDTGASGTRRKQNFVGFPIPGRERNVLTTRSTSYGVSLNLSWEIDLWGRLGAQAREGLAALQASAADLEAVRLSIAGQTAKAWFALAEARQQVELAARTVESFRRSVELVRRRFEQGVRPSLDLRLARTQLSSAEATLRVRRQQLDAAVRQLEVLVGRYPGGRIQPPEALVALPPPIPSGLPADLIGRRPDLAAAERRLVAADQRYRAARAALYPRIALTASTGTASNRLRDLVDGDFSVWSILGNLTAPLFRGGRLRAGVDLAAAGIDETLAQYVGTALRAFAEVETALAGETFLAEQEAHLQRTAAEAAAAEQLAEQRYRSGLSDYIDVLESQRRSFEAESALIAARRQRLANRVDLILALGGGTGADAAASPAATGDLSPAPEDER